MSKYLICSEPCGFPLTEVPVVFHTWPRRCSFRYPVIVTQQLHTSTNGGAPTELFRLYPVSQLWFQSQDSQLKQDAKFTFLRLFFLTTATSGSHISWQSGAHTHIQSKTTRGGKDRGRGAKKSIRQWHTAAQVMLYWSESRGHRAGPIGLQPHYSTDKGDETWGAMLTGHRASQGPENRLIWGTSYRNRERLGFWFSGSCHSHILLFCLTAVNPQK